MRLCRAGALTGLIGLLLLVPLFVQNQYYLHVLITAAIAIVLTSSLRSIAISGQFSLGHIGFVAVGAYASALLVVKAGLSFWTAFPLAGVAAGLLAAIVGYPFTRLKTMYFAILTMFLGLVIQSIIVEWSDLTGGSGGLQVPVPDTLALPGLPALTFAVIDKVPFYYLALALMLITLLFLYRIDCTSIGKTFWAIQQQEAMAESVGVDTVWWRVVAFASGAVVAGLAGAFQAHYLMVVTPDSFGPVQGIYLVVYMVVGGRRRFLGAILGASLLVVVPEMFRPLKEYQPFVFVAVLFLVVFYLRGGIIDFPDRVRPLIDRLLAKPPSGSMRKGVGTSA